MDVKFSFSFSPGQMASVDQSWKYVNLKKISGCNRLSWVECLGLSIDNKSLYKNKLLQFCCYLKQKQWSALPSKGSFFLFLNFLKSQLTTCWQKGLTKFFLSLWKMFDTADKNYGLTVTVLIHYKKNDLKIETGLGGISKYSTY